MAGIGGFLTKILGSENKARATGRDVDSRSYDLAGDPNFANELASNYTDQADAIRGRQGVQVDYGNANNARAKAMVDRAQQQQSRAGQQQVANLSLARAMGQTPSIAQMQADRQMGQAAAAQASLAGSARGAGALANAQRNAANNIANTQADISGQAQVAAANERLNAEQSAAQQYGQMRGGDLSSQGMMGQQQSQDAQQAQAQAGFADAQRARNDQANLAYQQLASQTRMGQLAARQNYEAQQSSNALGAQGINAGVGGQNAAMNQANGMSLLGMGQGLAGAAFSRFGGTPGAPPGKAKGGPVDGRSPYLVGEQGPELVIPAKDGMVIPAGLTREAIQRTPSLARFLSARADGGPVEGGGDPDVIAGRAAPPSSDAGYLPAGYAPPVATWGAPVDADQYRAEAAHDQRARMAPYERALANVAEHRKGLDATAARVNETVKGIDDRDEATVWDADYKDRHNQEMTAAEQDAAIEARYRQEQDRQRSKTKRKSLTEQLKGNKEKTLGDKMSDIIANAGNVDTAYHGPSGGYAPPMLVPLQARAFGGPIMGGGAPSMLVPLSGPGSGAAAPSFDVLTSSGGMDPMASLKAHSAFATRFNDNPGASPMGYSAREDGGPVKAGGQAPERRATGSRLKEAGDIFGDTHLDANRSYDKQPPRSPFAGVSTSGSGLTDRELAARDTEERATAPLTLREVLMSPAPVVLQGGADLVDLARAQAQRHAGFGVDAPAQGVGRVVEPDTTYDEERAAAEAIGGPDSIRRYPGAPPDMSRLAAILRGGR